jgi:quinol monooxygenase YgiN
MTEGEGRLAGRGPFCELGTSSIKRMNLMRTFIFALTTLVIFLVVMAGSLLAALEDNPHPLVIITHVDVVPQYTAPAVALLQDYRKDSRGDEGSERIEVLQQIGRPNHFTLVEEWADQGAYDKHVSAAHTRQFRDKLQPMLGAPYDERPHSVVGLK